MRPYHLAPLAIIILSTLPELPVAASPPGQTCEARCTTWQQSCIARRVHAVTACHTGLDDCQLICKQVPAYTRFDPTARPPVSDAEYPRFHPPIAGKPLNRVTLAVACSKVRKMIQRCKKQHTNAKGPGYQQCMLFTVQATVQSLQGYECTPLLPWPYFGPNPDMPHDTYTPS